MENIVIVGGGGHAKVVISVLLKNKEYSILGYVDNVDNGELLGTRYLGNDGVLEKLFKENTCKYAALGVGQVNLVNKRKEIVDNLLKLGFEFPAIISGESIINENVKIGYGTVVFDGVIISTGTVVGNYSIINTGAIIDHDCNIGNFTHLATGAVLSGGVRVNDHSMIGAGATIIQYREIGEQCMVGAGSVVINNCDKNSVYTGIPARKIK